MENISLFNSLRDSMLSKINFSRDMSNEALYELIDNEIHEASLVEIITLDERLSLRNRLFHSIKGLDVLDDLLMDEEITEIMVNGYNNIFIEKNGQLFKTNCHFSSQEKLSDVIQQIVASSNKRVNQASPIVDTRLPDGSRVNIVLNPISLGGDTITIRKFPKNPLTIEDFIRSNSITGNAAHFLKQLVISKYNIFVCGGTGSGKTTFLNVLSGFIPCNERIITIEDSAELQLKNLENLVSLEVRQANSEGNNEVNIRDLIKTSLRMRPDRIIVGEVRGAEALDMLQAMCTGHNGSLSTGHGNNPKDMLSRLETMVLMGIDIPIPAIRSQIAAGIDIIVHLARLRDGSRHILNISELEGISNNEFVLNTLFEFKEFDSSSENRVDGKLCSTGKNLKNTFKLYAAGLKESDLWS